MLFSSIITGCNSREKQKPAYSHEVKEERYAPDFKLKKGFTYYNVLQKHDENILLFWSVVCPHCEKDFPIYLDYNYKVFKQYQCEHIPTVYIINAKGKILAYGEGEKDSTALIKEFINHNN